MRHGDAWQLDNHFQAAFYLAGVATRQFFIDTVPPQLVKACGGSMATLIIVHDQRP